MYNSSIYTQQLRIFFFASSSTLYCCDYIKMRVRENLKKKTKSKMNFVFRLNFTLQVFMFTLWMLLYPFLVDKWWMQPLNLYQNSGIKDVINLFTIFWFCIENQNGVFSAVNWEFAFLYTGSECVLASNTIPTPSIYGFCSCEYFWSKKSNFQFVLMFKM